MNMGKCLFHPALTIPSLIIGICLSVIFGLMIWNQSKVNMDHYEKIQEVKVRLESFELGGQIVRLGHDLSEHNKKVANSKLLSCIDKSRYSEITDEYLKSLIPDCDNNAKKYFVVKEIAIIIAVLAGFFSLLMSIPSIWICLLSISLAIFTLIQKLKG
jgi:hypothetical protein